MHTPPSRSLSLPPPPPSPHPQGSHPLPSPTPRGLSPSPPYPQAPLPLPTPILSHCPFSPQGFSWSLPPFLGVPPTIPGVPPSPATPPPFPLSHHLPISRVRSRCHPGPHRAPIAVPIHPGVSPHFHPHLWGLPSQTPSLGVSPVAPSAPRASPIASHCSLGSLPLPPWCPGVPPGAPPPVLRALFPFPPPPQGLPHCTPPLHHSFPFLPEISPIVCPTVQGSLPSHILF